MPSKKRDAILLVWEVWWCCL